MKIISLTLENFQGVKAASFDFGGTSASIYGDNGTGKTTVFNALTWLLFDQASTGAKNYTPKTTGPDGYIHNLDHAAEAIFTTDDGQAVRLRKVFHEVWKKKRGSPTAEFTGHSVDFFVDGVPTKEKDYIATLEGFCGGAEYMKMLTMPDYFPEAMAWDARRKVLLEICGDISDQDVIDANEELEELDTYLLMPGTTRQFYTVDEYKKIATAKKADINRQLQAIPSRIDEAQRAIPEADGTAATIQASIELLRAEEEGIEKEKAAIIAGDTAAASARKAQAEAEAKLAEARSAYASRQAEENGAVNASISQITDQITSLQRKARTSADEASRHSSVAERMTARRNELLEQYAAIQAETWNPEEAVCPTCHRELPADQIEQMREAFNLRKSNRLQEINEHGKASSKAMIEAEEQEAARFEAEAVAAKEEITALEAQLDSLRGRLTTARFEDTDEYRNLAACLDACRAETAKAGNDTAEALTGHNDRLNAVKGKIREFEQQLARIDQAEAQRRRITDLEEQEKTLAAEFEELEKGIYLCDLFTKAKVRMLTDRINGKFKSVRFRLFQEQQNGGIRDDCEVLVPDTATGALVPYTVANNAGRISAGLEIIETLSKSWNLSMPVFIDNAEGITHLPALDMQIIRLVVSEPDAKLRLELDGQAKEGAA